MPNNRDAKCCSNVFRIPRTPSLTLVFFKFQGPMTWTANAYSKSYIQSSADFDSISRVLIWQRILPKLQDLASHREPVEVLGLNSSVALDFIVAYIFGLENGCNYINDIKDRNHLFIMISCSIILYSMIFCSMINLAPINFDNTLK